MTLHPLSKRNQPISLNIENSRGQFENKGDTWWSRLGPWLGWDETDGAVIISHLSRILPFITTRLCVNKVCFIRTWQGNLIVFVNKKKTTKLRLVTALHVTLWLQITRPGNHTPSQRSKSHNSTSHYGFCHVNYVRPLMILLISRLVMQKCPSVLLYFSQSEFQDRMT